MATFTISCPLASMLLADSTVNGRMSDETSFER
jgi:hypothetical protein